MKRALAAVRPGPRRRGCYGYSLVVTRREAPTAQLIDDGEAALARDNTSAAIEAFSGAIALKADSMLGVPEARRNLPAAR